MMGYVWSHSFYHEISESHNKDYESEGLPQIDSERKMRRLPESVLSSANV